MDNVRKLRRTGVIFIAFGVNLSVASFLIGIFTNLSYMSIPFVAGIYIDLAGVGILVLWAITWLILKGQAGKRKAVCVSE